jgi:glutaredoxin-like protein NrdH
LAECLDKNKKRNLEGRIIMAVTVYSKPACVQCVATYKELERKGVDFSVVDLTQDDQAFSKVQDLGYMQVPVVIAGEDHWAGFRPDKIGALS